MNTTAGKTYIVGEDRSVNHTEILHTLDLQLAIERISHCQTAARMVLGQAEVVSVSGRLLGIRHVDFGLGHNALDDMWAEMLGLADLVEHLL